MALDTSRIDRRFDTLKNKVSQEAEAAKQTAQEGLARKAVAQGAGGGAFAKLGMQQEKQIGAQKQAAINDIQGQQEQAVQAAEEVQANRDFAKSEREAAQGFASQQAAENRMFQSNEALAARGFSEKLFKKDLDFKNKIATAEMTGQFNGKDTMAMKQFNEDKRVSDFNMKMAEAAWNKKDLLESFGNVFGYDSRTGGNTKGGYGAVLSTMGGTWDKGMGVG